MKQDRKISVGGLGAGGGFGMVQIKRLVFGESDFKKKSRRSGGSTVNLSSKRSYECQTEVK